jgi:hypothetical protein
MKPLLLVLLLGCSAFAQNQASSAAAGCGPEGMSFQVKTDKKQHPMTSPEPGKALIYFIQDDSRFLSVPKPTTRVGLDGQWIGATHANSYFYFLASPGEHNLCTDWQSSVIVGGGRKSAAIHFTAEPGKVYDFMVQDIWHRDAYHSYPPRVDLSPVDPAQAQLQMSRFALSVSRPK